MSRSPLAEPGPDIILRASLLNAWKKGYREGVEVALLSPLKRHQVDTDESHERAYREGYEQGRDAARPALRAMVDLLTKTVGR